MRSAERKFETEKRRLQQRATIQRNQRGLDLQDHQARAQLSAPTHHLFAKEAKNNLQVNKSECGLCDTDV